MESIRHIIESLLFVTETPLTIDGIKRAIPDAETPEIRDALNGLAADYEARRGGFYLNEVAGGYQLRTRPEFTEWIKRLLRPKSPRMSKAALETLAIIAYRQPMIRSDIEHIRGVDSGGVLRALLERKLIRILGRRKIPGRPLIYATTKMFLEVFDLKDLKELPTPKEIEALEDEGMNSDDGLRADEIDPNQMLLFEDNNAPAAEADEDSGDITTETADTDEGTDQGEDASDAEMNEDPAEAGGDFGEDDTVAGDDITTETDDTYEGTDRGEDLSSSGETSSDPDEFHGPQTRHDGEQE